MLHEDMKTLLKSKSKRERERKKKWKSYKLAAFLFNQPFNGNFSAVLYTLDVDRPTTMR
jgi:hypothetical protein